MSKESVQFAEMVRHYVKKPKRDIAQDAIGMQLDCQVCGRVTSHRLW